MWAIYVPTMGRCKGRRDDWRDDCHQKWKMRMKKKLERRVMKTMSIRCWPTVVVIRRPLIVGQRRRSDGEQR
jgi:hypothetical protein